MATYNGREARVTIDASTTEKIILEIGDWSINMSADEIDTTSFGDGWSKSDVGMLKWSGSLSGQYDPADTTGQVKLKDAFLAGTIIGDIRFYVQYKEGTGEEKIYLAPDTASDASAGIRITSLDISTDKSGVANLSMSFSGSGPIKETTEINP